MVSLFLAVVLESWLSVERKTHRQAKFTSSILILSGKLKEYFNENPDVTFTNVSDYVRLGALNSNETAFLSNYSAVVIPPRLGGQELVVVEDGEQRVCISRYGEIQSWKFK